MIGPVLRPPVGRLLFRLFDRTIHPEFFDTLTFRRISLPGGWLSVRLTPTGHVLEWTDGRRTLVEVTATTEQELPAQGRRICHPFEGERRGRWEMPGVRYLVSSVSERVDAEIFRLMHEELLADSTRPGVVFHSRPHSRSPFAPLGLVSVQPLKRGLSVAGFHTFPDEFAVIKTQSLFEPCQENG